MWRAGALLVLLCGLAGPAAAQPDPGLVEVLPYQADGQLLCRLRTEGLPGQKQLQSMRSGLEASVELEVALVDEQENLLGRRSLSLRMGFDLWEEVFSVRGEGQERRFASLEELRAYLEDLRRLPVAPLNLLDGAGPCRLQVGLVVHAIAPDEQRRVEDVIAGDRRRRGPGQNEQEASVSLGRLIKLFYKGGGSGAGGSRLDSDWFTRREVPRAAH